MKKIFFLFILGLVMPNLHAQGLMDGLRYSTESVHGTARYNAMSGAFGALGGDLSGVALNPAGSAVFLRSYASASGSLIDLENNVNYLNGANRSLDTDAAITQAGAVWVFDNYNEESNWRKFTIGLNYELTNNFDDEVVSVGSGNISIDQYFLNQAQGIPLELLQLQSGETVPNLYQFLGDTEGTAAQTAFLGFQGFIIDPVDFSPDNTAYISNVAPGTFNQEHFKATNGYQGKYTVNFAAQYKDDLFFGMNLNAHAIDYRESTFLLETNNNADTEIDQIGFENNLWVLGSGLSAQFGAIAKINESFRIGLTYDTPTWLTISEETTQRLDTRRLSGDQSIIEVVDPGILNLFADYRLRTPGKIGASAAILFGQQGLISVDYGYKNYSNIEFTSGGSFFTTQNAIIANTLQAASSVRIGGEYRYNQWSFRGGYRYEQSPFTDAAFMSDLTGFSAGLGYAVDNVKIDLSYSRSQQDRSESLYSTGLTSQSFIDRTQQFFTLTVGFSM